ncbi:MAG: hypothetical protein ACREK6_04320, partial [Candidatus Rokuibacteriota bacterium]
RSCRERLGRLARVGPDWTAILFTGSGTAAVEAAVCSVVPPDLALLVVNNSAYGDRMLKIARAHGIRTVAVTCDNVTPVAPPSWSARGAPTRVSATWPSCITRPRPGCSTP